MISTRRYFAVSTLLLLVMALPPALSAQQVGPTLYQNMRWRMIGPFRGGRTVAATGVPGHQNLFYAGVNNGGVWRSDDYGRTWTPIFDKEATGSVGALAVAHSNPDIIYVGTGEGLQRPDLSTGNGVYKSTDAGNSWRWLGLRDGQQIGAIIVDPKDPGRLFVAVLGHPYGPNAERGVFRSTDGGETFQKVLYKDENTGAVALEFDPENPNTVYADLWAARQGPWENGRWQGPESGLYKSTDGGDTWTKLTKGLPTAADGLGRIGFAIAPSDGSRIYANVDAPKLGGTYRSDDAGASWKRVNSEERIWGRGDDFAEVEVDPKSPDVIYVCNTSTYKSTDAGANYTAWKGAPGGDDYHRLWINPENHDVMLLASDQGAAVTVNSGRTWSSWYNQPTAQFYHVITDNQFPYWVYGGQQESGSAGVASRGNDGQITFREWHPVGAEEYGYIAPDPLNPNVIYGGKVTRFDRITGEVQSVAPEAVRSGNYRFLRTQPLLFSPVDPHVLYFAGNVLFKTTNGGHTWETISPDLSREHPDVPANIGIYRTPELDRMPRRGVIYSIGPSYIDSNLIWAGTDDGLVHVTRDGGRNWSNVTPPALTAWSKVAQIDAGHFDKETSYIAVNCIRLDDMRPHIYRTHDGGKTWQEIVKGIPGGEPVNTVREDPVRKGLLFAGTENAAYVSFDDGDNWHSLRLNMPATSIRDLVIHDDDLIAGTHGRSFWILDDVTPLRQASEQVASSNAFLFKPEVSYRVKRDTNTDTPLPPEEPGGQNPPDGAIIDYYLKAATGPVRLEILDQAGKLVRQYSSSDKPKTIDLTQQPIPAYWIRPPQILSAEAGMQRFVWDLRYSGPGWIRPSFPISAIYHDTPPEPMGPAVPPGEYTIKLTAGDQTYSQPLTVKMDPRVKISSSGLQQQYELSMKCYDGMREVHEALVDARKLSQQLQSLAEKAPSAELKGAITALEKKAVALEGEGSAADMDIAYFAPQTPDTGKETLTSTEIEFVYLMDVLQGADAVPTAAVVSGVTAASGHRTGVLDRWKDLRERDVKVLNDQLRGANLPLVMLDR